MSQNGKTVNSDVKSKISGPSRLVKGAASLMQRSTTTAIPPHLAIASLRIALTAFFLGTVAGFVLPRALSILSLESWQRSSSSIAQVIGKEQPAPWQRPQFHLYLLSWSLFHLLEFVITARWNNTRLFSDSFLIQNGATYHLAHIFGITEFLIEAYVWPQWKVLGFWTCIGTAALVLGQTVRSLAMIQAGNNFSHQVAEHKRDDHELVTDGLYSYMRHPSYFGFFYWALGTQMLLCNPVSAVAFTVFLWRFFSHRIKGEETHLISFFGDKYIDYRKTTGTMIPFVR